MSYLTKRGDSKRFSSEAGSESVKKHTMKRELRVIETPMHWEMQLILSECSGFAARFCHMLISPQTES
jgi:hypothetical protein